MIFLVLKFENLKGFALATRPHQLVGNSEQREVGHGIQAAIDVAAIVQR